jgi:cobalt transporter subunit CbtB
VTITVTEQQTRGGRALFERLRARLAGVFHALYSPADRPEGSAMSIISTTGINADKSTASTTTTLSQRLTAAVCASILGASLVYFAGFSHIEAVHNAAHDTRHSAAFPCH